MGMCGLADPVAAWQPIPYSLARACSLYVHVVVFCRVEGQCGVACAVGVRVQ